MADATNPQHTGSTSYNQPGWQVGTVNQTVVVQSGPATEELTPARLAAIETRYRAQVVERYNRLGFAGLGLGDLRLSDVALDDVFVRLTLTVEKTVREPIPPEEWEREERSRNPFRRGEKKEDERPHERIITVQELLSLGDALAQHALIVGEPGAGKSTLLRWLAVTFAAGSQRKTDCLGPQADADRLPLLVELGRLPEAYLKTESRETPNWKTFLPEHLTKQPPFDDIPAPFLAQALAAGRCLLLCDGLDEIADLSARRRIADSLADYARSSANRLVLSSRPAGVSGSEASLGSRFHRIQIQRFTPEDVRRFFGFLYAQNSELTRDEQTNEADALFRAVEGAPKTLELATTPLLATLLFVLWNRNGYLPERRVELYELCCQMLIESWEAQHDVAYTGVLCDIGWERHLRLLAPLAYAIHNTGQRTDAPASELIPVLAQAMQAEGLAAPASATLEAGKFLRTLSLRSGLLQFLGGDRYGFPHLTFQEYLTARHIAAQQDPYLPDDEYDPDKPNYIDPVMEHLHEAWWREVHLLVIGYLGSGSEGVEKTSKLLLTILHLYPPPWRMLRSQHFNRWVPNWLRYFVNKYREHRIVKLPVYGLAIAIVLLSVPFLLAENYLAARLKWQLERRLAWVLEREFLFILTGFFDCSPLGVSSQLHYNLASYAQRLLLQVVLDPGRAEDFDSTGLVRQAAAVSLSELGQTSRYVIAVLVAELGRPNSDVRSAVADSLGLLGQASDEVVTALAAALDDSDVFVRHAAARSLGELGQASGEVLTARLAALGHADSDVREVAARNLGELGQASGEVLAALVGALNDSSALVRAAAAGSLGELDQASREVMSALLAALSDPNSQVRKKAATSLVLLGEEPGEVMSALTTTMGDFSGFVSESAGRSLDESDEASDMAVSALVCALGDSNSDMRQAAASNLGHLKIEDETELRHVLIALNRRLHDWDDDVRGAALAAIRQLLDGRQIPGYRWIPIRERREKAHKRRILGYWVIGVSVLLLVAWVAAGVATYWRVDPFIERFVTYALALVALAAGGVQVLGWLRRPPWDR